MHSVGALTFLIRGYFLIVDIFLYSKRYITAPVLTPITTEIHATTATATKTHIVTVMPTHIAAVTPTETGSIIQTTMVIEAVTSPALEEVSVGLGLLGDLLYVF